MNKIENCKKGLIINERNCAISDVLGKCAETIMKNKELEKRLTEENLKFISNQMLNIVNSIFIDKTMVKFTKVGNKIYHTFYVDGDKIFEYGIEEIKEK